MTDEPTSTTPAKPKPNFSHLDQLEIDPKKSRPIVLHALTDSPTLICLPATEANVSYTNARLKRAARMNRITQGGRVVTASMLDRTRDEDRVLYADFVIVGWSNVNDTDGKPVEFNKDNVKEYLQHLPSFVFDEVRNFASDPFNFTGLDLEEVSDDAKNA